MTSSVPNAQLTHVGMYVRDLPAMTEFYCRVLGMVVTDGGPFMGRELAFLSRDPEEHHQIVMIYDPKRPAVSSALNQISFRIDDLEGLRRYYALLVDQPGLTGLEGRNHGNSWSVYFFDPEGNKIELYVPTEWHVAQPWRAPLDLTKPADAIIAETASQLETNPATRPAKQWSKELRARLTS